MKLSCEVYEDLLLLYNDGLCSEDTKKLVEEHLNGCARCSKYLKNMRLPEEIVKEQTATEELGEDAHAEKESFRKSFRKIRRRWAMSLLVLPLLLVLSVPAIMVANEIRGEGICFSNLDDIWYCRQFFKLIADGEYDRAAGMLDFSWSYQNVREVLSGDVSGGVTEEKREIFLEFYGDILNMTEEEFEKQEQLKIAVYLQENPPLLRDFSFDDAYRTDYGWVISYEILEGVKHPNKDGMVYLSYRLEFVKNDAELDHVSGSIPRNWESRLGELEEELVLWGAFHEQGNQLSRRLNGWEQ
ncbi:MAG: zf-HC2 domain-containing protein [Lachnospiraceae bacterium]|nr:zf-HC2 domain-containing protein [Lachnospiraceae bacterium]